MTSTPEAKECKHDRRFRGVFDLEPRFKGCLACAYEAVMSEKHYANPLKVLTSEWQTDRGVNQVTCHSRMVDGVLCRWWGDDMPPGVAKIDAAALVSSERRDIYRCKGCWESFAEPHPNGHERFSKNGPVLCGPITLAAPQAGGEQSSTSAPDSTQSPAVAAPVISSDKQETSIAEGHDWQPDGGTLKFESHPGGEALHVHTTCSKCGARAWFLEYQWELLSKGCASSQELWPQAGTFHCACIFNRAEDFGVATLVTACAYHARREEAFSATRESVLEEAAKVCEQMRPVNAYTQPMILQYDTLDNAAKLIRALKR